MEYLKVKKIVNIVASIVMVSIIAALVILSVILSKKTAEIKQLRATNASLTEQVTNLTDYNHKLAEINGINIEVKFEMTQKNVLSQVNVNAQAIAKEICQITRRQVLDSLEVYANNNYEK